MERDSVYVVGPRFVRVDLGGLQGYRVNVVVVWTGDVRSYYVDVCSDLFLFYYFFGGLED